eukprot:1647530-Amphidinium_carterae.1
MKRSLEPKSQPWHLRDDRPHIALQDSLNLDAHVVDGFVARAKQGALCSVCVVRRHGDHPNRILLS